MEKTIEDARAGIRPLLEDMADRKLTDDEIDQIMFNLVGAVRKHVVDKVVNDIIEGK